MGRGRYLDIADGKPKSSKNLPNGHSISHRLNSLGRAHPTDSLILKTGKHVWKKRRWPNGIVVGKNDNIRRGVLDSMTHLQSLVRKGNGQDPDNVRVDLVGEVLERSTHFFFGDDENFLGFSFEPGVSRVFEFLACVNGGYYDRDVFTGYIRWVFGKWDWAIS